MRTDFAPPLPDLTFSTCHCRAPPPHPYKGWWWGRWRGTLSYFAPPEVGQVGQTGVMHARAGDSIGASAPRTAGSGTTNGESPGNIGENHDGR
jgi:hypothetical protein